jgi:hypothetical protein
VTIAEACGHHSRIGWLDAVADLDESRSAFEFADTWGQGLWATNMASNRIAAVTIVRLASPKIRTVISDLTRSLYTPST